MMAQCAHRRIHNRGSGWSCTDCGAETWPPDGCPHRHIDNDTWQCLECGEKMLSQTCDYESVLSAPNLAAGLCENGPDCDGGAGCTAVYVPDHTRAKRVNIGMNVTYECARCNARDGFRSEHYHAGDYIPIHDESAKR